MLWVIGETSKFLYSLNNETIIIFVKVVQSCYAAETYFSTENLHQINR